MPWEAIPDEVMPSGNNFIGPEGAGLKNQFSRDFNRFLCESSGTPDRKFLAGKPPKLPDEKKMRGLREGDRAESGLIVIGGEIPDLAAISHPSFQAPRQPIALCTHPKIAYGILQQNASSFFNRTRRKPLP